MKHFILFLLVTAAALAQLNPTQTWTAQAENHYAVKANLTYVTASNYESKLDVYQRKDASATQPTRIYIHGGGWVG